MKMKLSEFIQCKVRDLKLGDTMTFDSDSLICGTICVVEYVGGDEVHVQVYSRGVENVKCRLDNMDSDVLKRKL